jgi:hypothetical protein
MRSRLLIAALGVGLLVPAHAGAVTLIKIHPYGPAAVPAPATLHASFDDALHPATVIPANFVVQEVLSPPTATQEVLGPALPGVTLTRPDDSKVDISFDGLRLGTSAHYRVSIANIRGLGDAPATPSCCSSDPPWTFSTLPGLLVPPFNLTSFTAVAGQGRVDLAWAAPLDYNRARIRIVRREGVGIPTLADRLIGDYTEDRGSAVDTGVQPGVTYTYAAFALDRDLPPDVSTFVAPSVTIPVPAAPPPAAPTPGPAPTSQQPPTGTPAPTPAPAAAPMQTTTTKPKVNSPSLRKSPRLLKPARPHAVRAGKKLTVRWKRNPRAAYYNLQLFRGRRKVLTTFPAASTGVIPKGKLAAGSYRMLVWSGIGSKVSARYLSRPWVDQPMLVVAGPGILHNQPKRPRPETLAG